MDSTSARRGEHPPGSRARSALRDEKAKVKSIASRRGSTRSRERDRNSAVAPPEEDHDCGWKTYARAQEQELLLLKERLAALEKGAFGRKSEKQKAEKLPPPLPKEPVPRAEQKAARDALSEPRASRLETAPIKLTVASDARCCKECGSTALREVGEGKSSTIIEYVPGYFRKRIYLRQTLACGCRQVITAAPPARMGDKTRYAPSFAAQLCVSKCSDSIP